jgi:hypothetical protein
MYMRVDPAGRHETAGSVEHTLPSLRLQSRPDLTHDAVAYAYVRNPIRGGRRIDDPSRPDQQSHCTCTYEKASGKSRRLVVVAYCAGQPGGIKRF